MVSKYGPQTINRTQLKIVYKAIRTWCTELIMESFMLIVKIDSESGKSHMI